MDRTQQDPTRIDALLWMMTLDELRQALDVVVSWEREGTIDSAAARVWESRIRAWAECRQADASPQRSRTG